GTARPEFLQHQSVVGYIDDTKLTHNRVQYLHACQGKGTFLENFGFAVPCRVFHCDDHALRSGYKIHGATHSFDHFSGDRPVGESSALVDFHRAEHAQIDMATSDHGK